MAENDLVVLVDEQDKMLGTMPKSEVHGASTPLHRGFSVFVFRASDKSLLLQRRSATKRTWPLMWSNSCCGHPGPGESAVDASHRRLEYELGLKARQIEMVSPYRYCFTRNGIMENEICPILVGVVDCEPKINHEEVDACRWTSWNAFLENLDRDRAILSDWCIEEARILENTPRWKQYVGLSVHT
jgi:isopentenyl-diphosphate Delta-isomerase